MGRLTLSIMCLVAMLCIGLAAPLAKADKGKDKHKDENKRLTVQAAFGRGLNTNQPGNIVNHVILPNNIDVDPDGVVHFFVSGFHQVAVYKPGTTPDDIRDFISRNPTTTAPFINDSDNRFYLGIAPAGGPLGTAATTDPSNAQNRAESVSFPVLEGRSAAGALLSEKAEPGVYLVICNFRAHFQDGMFAFIEVKAEDEDD